MGQGRPTVWRVQSGCEIDAIERAAEVLRGGGLVVIPTDTVYGLAARAGDPAALERLYEAKGRDPRKPVPLLAAERQAVEAVGGILCVVARRLADAFWPGPLTLVLPLGEAEEGFRVPDLMLTRQLIAACGGLLRVTSANLSNEPPALDAREAIAAIGTRVDAVLDGGAVTGGVPSTVVRVVRDGIRVLRAGAISEARLVAASGMPVET